MTYIVNKNAQMKTGYHKIHTKDCKRKPKIENIIELGTVCPIAAENKARDYYNNVNWCSYCCQEINSINNRMCV